MPVENLRLRKWNVQSLAFEDAEWPADLIKMRDGLATRFIGFQVQRGRGFEPGSRREASLSVSLGDDNTLVAPVTLFEMPEDHSRPPKISILGFTIVRLDPVVIRDTLLMALTERHFHGGDSEMDYRVAVVKKDDPANVVWESEPGIAAAVTAAPDVTQDFMGPRPDQMFVFARNLRDVPPPPPPAPQPGTGPSTSSGPSRAESRDGNREPGTERRATPGARADNIVVSMIERETEQRRGGGGTARVITRGGGLRNALGVDGQASLGIARGRGGGSADAQPDRELEHPAAAHRGDRPHRRVGAALAKSRAAADGIRRSGLA